MATTAKPKHHHLENMEESPKNIVSGERRNITTGINLPMAANTETTLKLDF